jgi:hypothetical protein
VGDHRFVNVDGAPLEPPRARDLTTRNHAIIGSAERQPGWPAINWMAVWGY